MSNAIRLVLDAGIVLCLSALVLLLADIAIRTPYFSLSSYRNPFGLFLILIVLRTGLFGWPQLNSRQARRAMVGILFVLAIPLLQPHAGSDGDFYYAYLRSMTVDGDFSLLNEAAWYASGWMHDFEAGVVSSTGYGYSGATIGLAVFAAPLYVPTHWLMVWLVHRGLVPLADGYTVPEKMAVALITLLGVVFGAVFTYRVVRRWAAPVPAMMGTLTAILAGSLLCYGYHEGSFAHGLTFGLMAFWFALWLNWRGNLHPSRMVRLGFVLGLVAMVRPQVALFLLLPWLDWLLYQRHNGPLSKRDLQTAVWLGVALNAGWFAGFLPQMVVWLLERGSIFTAPQGGSYIDFSRHNHLKVLFHWYHGLFTWHPVHLVAFLALPLVWKRSKGYVPLLLLGFLFQLTLNSMVVDWWAGGAFGQRRLETALPLVAIGLGALLEWASGRTWARVAGTLVCLFLGVWNLLLLALVAEGPIYYENPIDPRTIWTLIWQEGPERLAMTVAQSPLWRTLRLAVDAGLIRLLSALLMTAVLLLSVAWLIRQLIGGCGVRLNRGTHLMPYHWLGIPVVMVIPFLSAHLRSEPVLTIMRPEKPLVSRQVRMPHFAAFQGGGLHETVRSGEPWTEVMPHPIPADTIQIVGWLEDAETWNDGRELGVLEAITTQGTGHAFPLVAGKDLLPRNHAYLPASSVTPNAEGFARAWLEPTSTAQSRPYIATRAAFRYDFDAPLAAITIRQNSGLTYHLEGLAFATHPHGLPEPALDRLDRQRDEPGRAIDLSPISNAEYRNNPFVMRDAAGRWQLFPHLRPGWWRGGDVKFLIARPYAESGIWPVLNTVGEKGTVWLLPLEGKFRRLALLGCAYETYRKDKRQRIPCPLIDVDLYFPSGRIERTPLFAHRDFWDYRDRYASPERLLRTDGFFGAKLHWTEIHVRNTDEFPNRITLHDANGPARAGVALFAITGYE